ncbi:hypothetical protein [Streptomyces sp. NRRL F-5630]|uniref:hypothetical protein n=1 Tax=Streptomyces sp. NRRL F-5630 TaxID=1463864 RepID=UPI00131A6175|nr:hypothetical protein [Streptomyces sp. NRRL F-5630]
MTAGKERKDGIHPLSVATLPPADQTTGHLVRRLLSRRGDEGTTEEAAYSESAALSLALDTAEALTPGELCETTGLLNSIGQGTLADSLVMAFARKREGPDVILAALALQGASEEDSLRLLLTTAAGRR